MMQNHKILRLYEGTSYINLLSSDLVGSKRKKVRGERRQFHNGVLLNDLYPSPTIVRVIKSRRMRWWGFSAYGGGERHVQDFGG
jgi:hypothetical protein